MGVLDQLKENALSPEKSPVEVDSMDPEAWSAGAVALAGHQAMKKGLKPQEVTLNPRPDQTYARRLQYGENATVDVSESLQVSQNYRSVLVSQLLEDRHEEPGENDVADYVFDGGIKEGRVTIHIVPERSGPSQSWDEVAKAQLVDGSGTPHRISFDKFSVNSISEPDQERYQIIETFGGNIIFGYGRRPRIMQITGQVLNGRMDVKVGNEIRSMDWKNALQRQYDEHFRLSECIKNHKRILLKSQDTLYVGYLLALQNMVSSAQQAVGQVTLTFIVAEREFVSENDDKIPGRRSESGVEITDKTVPEEFFPQARYEHYIKNSFSIQDEIEHTLNLIDQKVREILKQTRPDEGWVESRESEIEADANQEGGTLPGGVSENLPFREMRDQVEKLWDPESQKIRIYESYESTGVRVHKLLLSVPNGFSKMLKRTEEDQSYLQSKRKDFENLFGYDPLRIERDTATASKMNAPPESEGATETKLYDKLVADNGAIQNMIQLVRKKADLLNGLALDAMQLRLRLWKLKQL